jgi:hypothetical protein
MLSANQSRESQKRITLLNNSAEPFNRLNRLRALFPNLEKLLTVSVNGTANTLIRRDIARFFYNNN